MTALQTSGDELLHELSLIADLTPSRANGVFDAATVNSMVLAQIELLQSGYYFSDCKMVEGHFYVLRFMRIDGDWPYYVDLRFMTNGVWFPPLALMYREDFGLRQFFGTSTVYGTHTTDAENLLYAFARRWPDRTPFWLPVFAGSPLARSAL